MASTFSLGILFEMFKDKVIGTPGPNTIGVMLIDATYAFSNAHKYVADVVANELTGAGYVRANAGNPAVTQDATNNWATLKHDPTNHGSPPVAETIGRVVIFINTGLDSTSEIVAIDDTPDVGTTGGVITYTPPSNGHYILRQPASP